MLLPQDAFDLDARIPMILRINCQFRSESCERDIGEHRKYHHPESGTH